LEIFFPVSDDKLGREVKTDLLGDPVDLRDDNIGAPEHKKTEQKQRLVASLRLAKWSLDRIARYIDVTPKTLTKHYSRELDGAADLIEGAAIEVLLANMGKGFQGAAGKMLEMAREGRAVPPAPSRRALEDDPDAADIKVPVLGKKEAQAEAAKTPSDDWGDLLRMPGDSPIN
jgi:hypothetical protein